MFEPLSLQGSTCIKRVQPANFSFFLVLWEIDTYMSMRRASGAQRLTEKLK